MAALSFRLDGQREVSRKVEAYAADVQRKVAAVVADFAFRIEGEAKQRAPVDTGFLRANVRADVERVLTALAADVVSGASYSTHIEFGTSRMGARPFLFPALESHRAAFVAAIREATK